jgi:hypothetical protein
MKCQRSVVRYRSTLTVPDPMIVPLSIKEPVPLASDRIIRQAGPPKKARPPAVRLFLGLMARVAPLSIVRDPQLIPESLITGILLTDEGIRILSAKGTPEGFQFPAEFQLVPPDPVHVRL